MSAFEDQHGTYIMNSRDLRGATCGKAGGHCRTLAENRGAHQVVLLLCPYAQVYRRAIDDAVAGKPFDPSLLSTLEGLAHRGYTEGFLRRHTHQELQNYDYGYSVSDRQQFVGEFSGERRGERAEVLVKNKFACGDSVELMTPQGNIRFTVENMTNSRDEAIDVAPGNGHTVYLPVPPEVSLHYALLLRNLDGTTTRQPHGRPDAAIA